MFTKMLDPLHWRMTTATPTGRHYDDHAVIVARALKAETIVGLVPREMPRTFWNFIMHGGSVGCEITGRRTLIRCEITRKRMLGKGGAWINEGGAFTIPFLSMWKNSGRGRINDGGHSGGTLRYMYLQ